jgi:hypothetical protein
MRWAGLDVPVRSRCRPVESSSAAFIRDLNTRDGLTRDARECGAPVFREIFHVLVYVCAYVCVCVCWTARRCVDAYRCVPQADAPVAYRMVQLLCSLEQPRSIRSNRMYMSVSA